MTLLAVELERPDERQRESAHALGDFLVGQRGSYLAFALSFALSAALAWPLPYTYVMWFLAPIAAACGATLIFRLRTRLTRPPDRTKPLPDLKRATS